jgi:hypothetical protein
MEKERILKHINWQCGALRGRIAVFFDEEDGYLEVQPVKGCNLPVGVLFNLLDVALGKNWRREAVKFFHGNEKPWRVDVRQGMSGCRTFRTVRLENERLLVVKTTATVHVSMFGKLKGIRGFLGELAPIFERILEIYPTATVEETEHNVCEGSLNDEWVFLEVARLPKDDFHHPLVKLYLETEEDKEPEQLPKVEVV